MPLAEDPVRSEDVAPDAWADYTPTLTSWTLGNGTLTGRFMQTNSLVHYSISYTVGSTDTKSGSPVFSLPVTALSPVVANWPRGNARLFDTSAAAYRHRTARHTSVTTVGLTDEDGTLVSATVPWTWATGDNIGIQGTYEAA